MAGSGVWGVRYQSDVLGALASPATCGAPWMRSRGGVEADGEGRGAGAATLWTREPDILQSLLSTTRDLRSDP
jgi:hypothetical protein